MQLNRGGGLYGPWINYGPLHQKIGELILLSPPDLLVHLFLDPQSLVIGVCVFVCVCVWTGFHIDCNGLLQ